MGHPKVEYPPFAFILQKVSLTFLRFIQFSFYCKVQFPPASVKVKQILMRKLLYKVGKKVAL
jgi:hypothetical protein